MKKLLHSILWLLSLALIMGAVPAKASSNLSVSGRAAVLMEQKTGRVLFEKQAHTPMRIASITKIMTAILAIESGKMEKEVLVTERAVRTEGSSIYLKPGEKIKLKDLVYGLMLRSGNDAAAAIAEYVGGSEEGFAFLMNQKAAEIGMLNTYFSNPHGLDNKEKHFSTAYDMALLTRYAMGNDEYKKIAGTKVHHFPDPEENWDREWRNKNRLLSMYRFCTGGKTGYTKRAKRTLVTTAKKGDMELIAVTLNAPDDWNDHIQLFESGFASFRMAEILPKGKLDFQKQPYKDGELYIDSPVLYPVTSGEESKLTIDYKLLEPTENKFPGGSKKQGALAGKAIILLDGRAIKTVPVYFNPKKNRKTGYLDEFKHFITLAIGIKGNG
ncbi:D-alanyl-D-alanine carboxypeptidase [Neobacillus notoginsengisoli]|uniref:D-alanyl-D-alanine carboxypeptidase n=1 Tax=Neobacillus notoginsengisoli TaxID=1578198 RepID=A0A417YV70_9BACI|nr:D-alanyl-D-alanine carboxypeptidase family protein [Neobacillus notoginsengisoli]RHW41203.1 D-alanyl-D-alanine carboxypeptidase [Neobacillus notoginsengisoli]